MRNIALCMQLSDFYEHGIARGVVRYAKSRPDWRIYGYGWMFRPLADIGSWRGDGIIARIEDAATADRIAALGSPVVDVAGAYTRRGFAAVTNDDRLTGERAAEHLIECGFRRFAFLGVAGTHWSDERRTGFGEALAAAGFPGGGQLPSFERSLAWWEREREDRRALASFLAELEAPVAVFACNDMAGLRAAELARTRNIPVPDSVAILGVDDEDILCELASPSLSSIRLDCEAIGYRAAQALDEILGESASPRRRSRGDGEGKAKRPGEVRGQSSQTAKQPRPVTLPPKEVIERESTRIFACEDRLVASAVNLIRARAHEGIDVSDILASIPASRRSLEQRFRSATGRSLHEEIVAARLRRAKQLLREGSLTLDFVAEESGFGTLQRFHAAFRAAEGVTPGEWRRKNRG